MRDKLYEMAIQVERLLQFIDANKTGNPGEVRFIVKKLRKKIAETREIPNKHPEGENSAFINRVKQGTVTFDELDRIQQGYTMAHGGAGDNDHTTQNPSLSAQGVPSCDQPTSPP